jgi:hypothetical protein
VEDLIRTPYGEVRAEGLEELQSSFDTRGLLNAAEELDRFCAQWKRELRDGLLEVHGMAHTVNGATEQSSGQRKLARSGLFTR